MAKLLSRCPVCQEGLLAPRELCCEACGAAVRAEFEPCRFCALSAEQSAFIELFLRCEGNISRVERELGISYPTVRNRLTQALRALGLARQTADEAAQERRREILRAVARGDLPLTTAADALNDEG